MPSAVPRRLADRYELIAEAAEGPLATLWRGSAHGEAGFRRPVAVRILREPWARERAILGAWAAIASDLAEHTSPHVEQTLDVVMDDGRPCIVTEWIEGISLRRYLADHAREGRSVPWQFATSIAIEVLRGLAAGHAGRPPLCHDAIDPRSVRLGRDGTVRLVRFGVASALGVRGVGRRRLEELGLRHPAPELVDGGGSSPASDVFAVGALMVELLCGRAPFDAPPGEARDALVRRGALRDPASARSDVPAALLGHLAKATAAEPTARFASASAMIRALAGLLRDEAEAARPEALAASVLAVLERPRPELRPRGLAEARTMQVDLAELTVLSDTVLSDTVLSDTVPSHPTGLAPHASPPLGLAPQKTEWLDPEQVDRLRLPDAPPPPLPPRGLAPPRLERPDAPQDAGSTEDPSEPP